MAKKRSLTETFSKVMGQLEPEEKEEKQETPEVTEAEEKGQDNEPKKDQEPHQDQEAPQQAEEEEEGLISKIKRKKQQKKVEDTHSRQTFLVRNDLLKEINRLSKKYGYGFKTMFINEAIERELEKIREEEEKIKRDK